MPFSTQQTGEGLFRGIRHVHVGSCEYLGTQHNYHHAHNSKLYTSSIGSFPIVTKEKYLSSSTAERTLYMFVRHPLTIGFGYIFMFLYGMCIRSIISNKDRHWDSIVAMAVHFGIGVGIYFLAGWSGFFFGFAFPFLMVLALGSYLFYAQHNFPGATFTEKDGWTYADAALDSSSHMKMSAMMRWFLANIGFHHIHHLNPRIPFYRLPEVHRSIPGVAECQDDHPASMGCRALPALESVGSVQHRMIGRREIYA
ncbi:MAG: fatty acid desaturase [Flavobacteriales bacterium]|nr:fatty acid desaturase [Flavobacteriales bacterium]